MAHALLAPLPLPFHRHRCPPAFQDDQGMFTDFQKYQDVLPNLFSRKSILIWWLFFPETAHFWGEEWVTSSTYPRNHHQCPYHPTYRATHLPLWHIRCLGVGWAGDSKMALWSRLVEEFPPLCTRSVIFFQNSGCIRRSIGSLLKRVVSWSMPVAFVQWHIPWVFRAFAALTLCQVRLRCIITGLVSGWWFRVCWESKSSTLTTSWPFPELGTISDFRKMIRIFPV